MVAWFLSSCVSAGLQVLFQTLTDYGIDASGSVSEVDKKLGDLKRNYMKLQFLIHKAEDEQITDLAWQPLLQDYDNAAYELHDLLDDFSVEASKVEVGQNFVSQFFLSRRTSNIQVKLDNMLSEIQRLYGIQGSKLDNLRSNLQTSSLTDKSRQIFGREIDKNKVMKMLKSSRRCDVYVLPIVGIIGVGKTTLARLVYNSYETESHSAGVLSVTCSEENEVHFDLKMWVSVNREFDVLKLTRSIIEAVNQENTSHLLNLESLQIILVKAIQGKKFLLVLDDLWNEKRDEWDLLIRPLKNGVKGNKIIVTTGSHVVSSFICTDEPYYLECLSEPDCWSLLKQDAVENIDISMLPNLEAIGKEIAKKCKGLPLATKVLGRQLHSNVDADEWNNILESGIWDTQGIKRDLLSALKTGYGRLPFRVRQCFAFCSMFPQCYDFEKDKIVRMWMAQGLIIPDAEREMPEDVGSDYIDQLLWKSFILVKNEKQYMIHDIVHEMAQSVSGQKFLRTDSTSRINGTTRHLSLVCDDIQTVASEVSSTCTDLRTLLLFSRYRSPPQEVPPVLFKLGSLLVLDLSATFIKQLTGSIGDLKHLHFLDLSNTFIMLLPETIYGLRVLQTLRLINCAELLRLPKRTGMLKSLRHLELGGNNMLSSMPSGIGELTGLQTVNEFIIGREMGRVTELKNMDNIRGSLTIKQLENVRGRQDGLVANLAEKKYLQRLEFHWTSCTDAHIAEHVLESLTAPHQNLQELVVKNYGGKQFPKWVSDTKFSKLTAVCLDACKNCNRIPPLGQIPKLKSLKVVGMNELSTIDDDFLGNTGFQSLEILELRKLLKVESWVGLDENHMPRLRELTIHGCPEFAITPSLHYLQSLEELKVVDCPKLSFLSREGLSVSVKSLTIAGCPMLEEQCKRDGEDWMKINHICCITIGEQTVTGGPTNPRGS